MTQDRGIWQPDESATNTVESLTSDTGGFENDTHSSHTFASSRAVPGQRIAVDPLSGQRITETLEGMQKAISLAAQAHYDVILETSRQLRPVVLLDAGSLFILRMAVTRDQVALAELDNVIANATGWSQVIRLVEAGLVTFNGSFLLPTEAGRSSYVETRELLDLPE